MTKKLLSFESLAFEADKRVFEGDLKIINRFLDAIRPIIGDVKKAQYDELVNHGNEVNINYFNKLVYNRVLDSKPTLKSLAEEVGEDGVRKFGNIPTYVKENINNTHSEYVVQGLCQASSLNRNRRFFSISKGIACFVSGAMDDLKELHTTYAETEKELQRLEICEQIKELTLKLLETSENKELFDMGKSIFTVTGAVDQLIVKYGQHKLTNNDLKFIAPRDIDINPRPKKPTLAEALKGSEIMKKFNR